MIDLTRETPIPLAKAAKVYTNRQGDQGVNVATVWRHATRGVRGVKLESMMVGGIRMTSKEAVLRFFERVTAVAEKPVSGTEHAEKHQLCDHDRQAAEFLAARGI
jgi:hypothetical protein